MYDLFFQKFHEKVPLRQDEVTLIKSFLTPKKLRKKQYFLQEGDICKHLAFVEKGALRCYILSEAGDEHITAFALEGWTTGDLQSFIKQDTATLNIDALEDSELVLIANTAHHTLLQKLPAYETWFRLLITDAYMALQRRTTNMISLPLEDRYRSLVELQPDLLQRVPQHMIASFMGITPETLSRLRTRINGRK